MIDLHREILKSMRASPVILSQLVAGLDDEHIRHRPAAGEWAVIEVVAHLADVDERAHARLARMLDEDNPGPASSIGLPTPRAARPRARRN